METIDNRNDLSHKKQYGVYYTPIDAAYIMSNWAIRTSGDLVLEPSFGGCNFLRGISQRLDDLSFMNGSKNIGSQVFGADIDEDAFSFLDGIFKNGNTTNFIKKDFMLLTPADFGQEEGFDVVIGNPPYVSYHNTLVKQRNSATEALKSQNVDLPSKPSLWAYFVLHSMNFLKSDGRMVWVLPGSLLYTDYGDFVRNRIQEKFKKSIFIKLGERLFVSDDTQESSVLMFCDGFDNNKENLGSLVVEFADELDHVQDLLSDWEDIKDLNGTKSVNPMLSLLDNDCLEVYENLSADEKSLPLGDICDIQIGIVSGNNKFFIMNRQTFLDFGLQKKHLRRILSKFSLGTGLLLDHSDIQIAEIDEKKCFMAKLEILDEIPEIANYLEQYPSADRDRATFKKREKANIPWYLFDDRKIPDAFFPYMRNKGPILMLNSARVNSTNSIHRVYFHDKSTIEQKAIAIALLSSFSQLSAEIEGRAYGTGVLKHEPSEAKRIKIFLPNYNDVVVGDIFAEIHQRLINGEDELVTNIADEFVFGAFDKIKRKRITSLFRAGLEKLGSQRKPPKKG